MRVLEFSVVLVTLVANAYAFDDLIDVIQQQGAQTLLDLISQAGLTDTLRNKGPFTVLVPTDAAFAKIPSADLQPLTQNVTALSNLLQYHVLNGELFAFDINTVEHFTSINGHHIRAYSHLTGPHSSEIYFNQALAVKEEIQASNGVVYLISEVLNVPEGMIINILNNADYNISMFLDIATTAGFDRNFNNTHSQRYTVFAPSNAAFMALPATLLHNIQTNIYYAQQIVKYQVHVGLMHSSSLGSDGSIPTLDAGHFIKVSHDPDTGVAKLNDVAHIVQADIEAENGIVHVTSHVLIPSNLNLGGGVIG